jgi:hypothetical protein
MSNNIELLADIDCYDYKGFVKKISLSINDGNTNQNIIDKLRDECKWYENNIVLYYQNGDRLIPYNILDYEKYNSSTTYQKLYAFNYGINTTKIDDIRINIQNNLNIGPNLLLFVNYFEKNNHLHETMIILNKNDNIKYNYNKINSVVKYIYNDAVTITGNNYGKSNLSLEFTEENFLLILSMENNYNTCIYVKTNNNIDKNIICSYIKEIDL